MMKQVSYPSRGKTIYGFAHVPETTAPGPALILSHGFTGSGYESSRLFVHLAEAACRQGIYVMRIDFLGSGNSDADFAENTYLSGWVADVLAGVDFLATQPEVDPARIGALGISFGAAASLIAGRDPRIKAAGGWASVIHPESTFRGIFTDEKWDYLAQGNKRIEHVYAGARFGATSKFVEDVKNLSVTEAVQQYGDKPLLLMQGDLDPVIDITHSAELAAAATCPVEYHLVKGEDHSFLVHMEDNIATTLDFFRHSL